MTVSFLGKANSYSHNEGKVVSVVLSKSSDVLSGQYVTFLSDIVRDNKVKYIILDGDNIFSQEHRKCLQQILGLMKSLHIQTYIVTDGIFEREDIQDIQTLLDADYTNIILRLDADDVRNDHVQKNLDALAVTQTSNQKFIGHAVVENKEQTRAIFDFMKDYNVENILLNKDKISENKENALLCNVKLHEEITPDITLFEQNTLLVSHYYNKDKIAA